MADQMERKTFRGRLSFKADKPGEFTAVIATLNVKDEDGDVSLPGAFTTGEQVRISHWGHGWDQLPTGRGVIREEHEEGLVDGRFFLSTQTGKEHYETVKGLGELQEWSYGYDVLESEYGQFEGEDVRFLKRLKVIEVSPVMLGAGVGTRTTTIKRQGETQLSDVKEMIQQLHEVAVELGAKCAEPEDSGSEDEGDGQDEASDGKSRARTPSTLAERIAIDLIEYGIEGKE
ncbi:MAG TPA: HK97 family phage prohead protease [Anaerolineae bacterium]|nr:HK97 family phage prohead protease [Anaerolineae bacterium]